MCGTQLVASAPAMPALGDQPGVLPGVGTTRVSERRWVSVLFCDLVGFTTLSESKDAEEVRELLSSYFDVARMVVERYGGTVEKFIGDAVMALWGVPSATEDDAERAVRAALDLVAAVARLGEDKCLPSLAVRAGVVTGEAAVTLGAKGQGMVAGDLVNTASRIQSAAPRDAVLAGDGTYAAARDAIAFEDAGMLELKGKGEAVHAWRAVRVVAQRKGVGRSGQLEPPFVGRMSDLRVLVDALHSTAAEQKARLVAVTGIPGIGKSRLASEFLKYVDGLAESVYWHHGRSPAYGEGVSFWALGEMVRERCSIVEGENARSARTKLASALEHYVADADERRWIEPRLAHLLGLADAPAGDRQELFSAWRTFFERVADRGTTVMVFEDLQWANSGLLDFIESVIEWSREHPILVVTLARPELTERRPTWGALARSLAAIHLEPLSDEAMADLVAGLVPSLPEDATAQLVGRAEGVPLYAVETVCALVDRGVVIERDGVYELVGQIEALKVPVSLHSLIASRLDALSPEQRDLVQDASVLGATFTPALLAAVTQHDPEDLAGRLRSLVRKEILFQELDPRSPERGQYGFVQSMIKEVAYSTLSKKDRRAKHLAVAHELEAVGDEELAGVVASHYMDAYRASADGPEAKAVAARARDGLSLACARALSLGSPEQALAYAEQALEITTTGPERAGVLELAGEAARLTSKIDESIAYYEEAVAFYGAAHDPVAAGRVTAELARSITRSGRPTEAIARLERSLAALEGAGGVDADMIRVRLTSRLATGYAKSGSPERALDVLETALPIAERLGDPKLLREAIIERGGALWILGRRVESSLLVRIFKEFSATGSLRDQAEAVMVESLVVREDDLQGALRLALEAADLYRRSGDRSVEILNLLNATEFALYLGDWDQARATLAEVDGRTDSLGRFTSWYTCCVALLDALTGELASAEDRFHESAAEMERSESVTTRDNLHHARAMARLAAGRLDEARTDTAAILEASPSGLNSAVPWSIQARAALWAKDVGALEGAIEGMGQLHGRWMRAVRATAESGLRALHGDLDGAADAYVAAADTWRSLRNPLDLALCGVDAALVLGDDQRVSDLVEESRAILTHLGALPFLAVLDERTRKSATTAPPVADAPPVSV
jgi:class 3 adenylate cyclase/tetratricopeptide (TPR) repeat protein